MTHPADPDVTPDVIPAEHHPRPEPHPRRRILFRTLALGLLGALAVGLYGVAQRVREAAAFSR